MPAEEEVDEINSARWKRSLVLGVSVSYGTEDRIQPSRRRMVFFIRPDVLDIQLLSHDWVVPAAGEAFFGCTGEGGDGDVMQIIVNGKQVPLTDQVRTIRDLLDSYQLMEKIVVVEQNGTIIERSQYENQTIADGDRIEIVHFVGGG